MGLKAHILGRKKKEATIIFAKKMGNFVKVIRLFIY